MFKLQLRQITSQQVVRVDVFQDTDGPKMTVTKKWDFASGQVTRATVLANVQFGINLDSREAREASEWYSIAAQVAEQLDALFHSRDDLRHWIEVELLPDYTVEISFKDFD